MSHQTDTIVALATPPGPSAIAVVRLSGSRSLPIVRELCRNGISSEEPGEFLRWLRDPDTGETIDRAMVRVYRAPRSYTGEDSVEISSHGGWLVPMRVVDACSELGARKAEPGEFSRRAYLNGKLDLVQAEAVLDVVSARSRAMLSAATVQLERGLSDRISGVRERLVALEATLVHHIDFPEEDDAPVSVSRIAELADELSASLSRLLDTAPEGELLREGALTVLAGPPNAGKSSLFNALIGRERAIVTEVPGTTRDALEATVSVGGFPFLLVDTAGIRAGGGRVERMGIEVARGYVQRADLVLFCVDAAQTDLGDAERFAAGVDAPVVLLRTKADASAPQEGGGASEAFAAEERVSVFTGDGLDALRSVLPGLVFKGLVQSGGDVPVLTRARQTRGIRDARAEIDAFAGALRRGVPPEVASTHLRPAETALEEVLGVIPREEILDRLFSEFCVGK